jgi:CheY-like chemotaxis protein
LRGGVYANEFPAGYVHGLCAWTLYNANPRTVEGPIIRVPHLEGARYVDAWREEPADVRIEGDTAIVSLRIGPRDVGCIVCLTDQETVEYGGEHALLVTDGMTDDQADRVEALLIGEAIAVERAEAVPAGVPRTDLVVLDSRASGRSPFDCLASLAGQPDDRRPRAVMIGHAQDDIRAAWEAGADAFFRWPVDLDEFRRLAKRLVREGRLNRGE